MKRLLLQPFLILFLLSILSATSCGDAQKKDTPRTDEPVEISFAANPSPYSWQTVHGGEELDIGRTSILDPSNIWALKVLMDEEGGYWQATEIYHFDGSAWERQLYLEGEQLRGICALDENHVWAVGSIQGGYSGVIYFFDGVSWTLQHRGAMEDYISVAAVDASCAWASGDGIYFFDGATWNPQFEETELFSQIAAADRNSAWSVIHSGEILGFDGSDWNVQYDIPDDFGIGSVSPGPLFALDSEHVWATYTRPGTRLLFYDGSSWSLQETFFSEISAIYALDPYHAWACERQEYDFLDSFYFYDGTEWLQQGGVEDDVIGLFAEDEDHVWAVGSSGSIYLGER